MQAAGRIFRKIVGAQALVTAVACIARAASAETLRTAVTEIYPEIVAKSMVVPALNEPDPRPRQQHAVTKKNNNRAMQEAVDYADILGRQFANEVVRRKYNLDDMRVQRLVSDINARTRWTIAGPLFDRELLEEDFDRLADYGKDVLREAADELVQEIGWLDSLENSVKSAFRYELSVGGDVRREHTNRDFEWEDRKEDLRERETTVVNASSGARRPYNARYGVSLLNIGLSNGSLVEIPYFYARWEKLPAVDKVKLKVQPLEEVSVSVRNAINERWYWQNKALLDGNLEPRVHFSLTRRDELRKNRITFFTEFGDHGQVGVMFGVLL